MLSKSEIMLSIPARGSKSSRGQQRPGCGSLRRISGKTFQEMDEDQSGKVSPEEFVGFVSKFVVSDESKEDDLQTSEEGKTVEAKSNIGDNSHAEDTADVLEGEKIVEDGTHHEEAELEGNGNGEMIEESKEMAVGDNDDKKEGQTKSVEMKKKRTRHQAMEQQNVPRDKGTRSLLRGAGSTTERCRCGHAGSFIRSGRGVC